MSKQRAERYPVEVHWSDEDSAYLATVYDLPGCMADGETVEAAIAAARKAARHWIEAAEEQGRDAPGPSNEEPASGKLLLRLPVSLHRQLRDMARRESVPLNQYLVALLTRQEATKAVVAEALARLSRVSKSLPNRPKPAPSPKRPGPASTTAPHPRRARVSGSRSAGTERARRG